MKLSDLPFQPMGTQPGFDAATLEAFVSAPRIAVLAYTKRDGSPAQTPIWYLYRGGKIEMLTSTTSPKAKALARNPRVCVTIQDERAPYRAVIIDGTVAIEDAPVEGGVGRDLAIRYFGRMSASEYEKMTVEENRKTGLSLLTLTPTRVRGFDNHRIVGAGLRVYMRLREMIPLPRTWF